MRTQTLTLASLTLLVLPAMAAISSSKPGSEDPLRAVDEGYGKYQLVCWQGGQEIFSDIGSGSMTSLDLRQTEALVFDRDDGSRVFIVELDESLCRVEITMDANLAPD